MSGQVDNLYTSLVSSEIREKVFDFIKNHPNCTKNKVVKEVKDYSRLTILEAIDELMDSDKTGERVKYSRDKPKGFYKLFINDQNEFNRLISEINQLRKIIKTADTVNSIPMINEPRRIFFQTHLPNLIQLVQLVMFSRITEITTSIEKKIASSDDRKVLYPQIVKIMTASNKLNKVILPEVIKGLKLMSEDLKKVKVVKEKTRVYASIVNIVRTGAPDSDSNLS